MPAKKQPKKTVATKKKQIVLSKKVEKKNVLKRTGSSLNARRKAFLVRRPHRSFRLTRRRDYVRSLKLPGYIAFTQSVFSLLWKNKKIMTCIVLLYALLSLVLIGLVSQSTYATLSSTLHDTSGDIFKGAFGKVGAAGLLLVTGISGNFSAAPSETQQLYGVIIGLLVWLTTVWTLRALLAGQRPRFRDALYNSGAPIVPTFLIALVVVVQLIPAAIGALILSAGTSSGLTSSGVEAMAIFASSALLFVLSLYWITSGLIALVVVTLPGKYPMQAIRTAGDLVVGRRLRLLLRCVWMALVVGVIWAVIMIPVILFDAWLKGVWSAISWLPIVPVLFLIMSSFTLVFCSAYVYMLYRKVVDDDAKPAR